MSTYQQWKYHLPRVSVAGYDWANMEVLGLCAKGTFANALKTATVGVRLPLAGMIEDFGNDLQEEYGEGGRTYSTAFCIGFMALRSELSKASKAINDIYPGDWELMLQRSRRLQSSSFVETPAQAAGIATYEIEAVNPGYAEGSRNFSFSGPVAELAGYSGLGSVHAHDLLHFAAGRIAVTS